MGRGGGAALAFSAIIYATRGVVSRKTITPTLTAEPPQFHKDHPGFHVSSAQNFMMSSRSLPNDACFYKLGGRASCRRSPFPPLRDGCRKPQVCCRLRHLGSVLGVTSVAASLPGNINHPLLSVLGAQFRPSASTPYVGHLAQPGSLHLFLKTLTIPSLGVGRITLPFGCRIRHS